MFLHIQTEVEDLHSMPKAVLHVAKAPEINIHSFNTENNYNNGDDFGILFLEED